MQPTWNTAMNPYRNPDQQRALRTIGNNAAWANDLEGQDAWYAWSKQWRQLSQVFATGDSAEVQQWIQDHPDFDLHQNTPEKASALGEAIHQWKISQTPEIAERRLAMVQTVLEHMGGWQAYAQSQSQLNGWMVPVASEYTLMTRPTSHGHINPACQGTQLRLLQILVEAGMPLNEPHVCCDPAFSDQERFPLDIAMDSDQWKPGSGWVASVLAAGADPRARRVDGQRWIDATLAHLSEDQANVHRASLTLILNRVGELDAQAIPEPTPSAWMAQRQASYQHEQAIQAQTMRDEALARQRAEDAAKGPKTFGAQVQSFLGRVTPSRQRRSR